MAIVSVNKWRGVGGSSNIEDGTQEFTERWQVISNAIYENEITVLTASGLPVAFQPHPNFPAALAYSIEASQDEASRKVWWVDVNYKTFPDEDEQEENPLNRPPKITRDGESREVPRFKDINGKTYANSLGEPYLNPPIMMPDSLTTYTVEQNLAFFNSDTHDAYENSINSDVFVLYRPGFIKTFAVGTALLKSVSAHSARENDVYHWKRKMVLVHNKQGWNTTKHPLDYSYHHLNNAGKMVRTLDATGNPTAQPALLDSNKTPLLPHYQAGGWTFDPTTDPQYNTNYEHFEELPFSVLNFI